MSTIGGLETIFKLSVIMNMVDNLTRPAQVVDQSLDKTTQKIQTMQQKAGQMTKSGIALTSFGLDMAKAALSPVEATFATQKALGEMSAVGVKDLKALETAATNFSNKWSGTNKADFISAAYDIKGGINSLSDEGVAKYTEIAALTAKGTRASVAEMTSLFATGYGIYKDFYDDLSDIEFAEMFSAGIAQAVNIFKSDGKQMSAAISTLGASATTANVPLEEQLSILGMLQATMSGSESGTKYRAFLQSAARAGKELKLSFMDANNQLLSMPEILLKLKGKFGETLDAAEKMEIQKAFGTDEAVALIDLMYSKTDVLQESILDLHGSMGQGTKIAIEMAEAMNKDPGSRYQILQQQMQNLKETLGNQLIPTVDAAMTKGSEIIGKVTNWVNNNQELAGTILKVVLFLGLLMGGIGAVITVTGAMGLMYGQLALGLKNFGTMLTGIKSGFETMRIYGMYAGDAVKASLMNMRIGATMAINSIKSVALSIFNMARTAAVNAVSALRSMATGMIQMARQAIMTAITALPGLIASVWAFTAALLANPITWVVIGIVALIAALVLLWKNWDTVTSFIKGVFNAAINGVVNAFNWVHDKIMNLSPAVTALIAVFFPFIGIPMLIMQNFGTLKEFFGNLISGIRSIFDSFIAGIKLLITNPGEFFAQAISHAQNVIFSKFEAFKESGQKLISTFTEGIKNVISAPYEAVKGGLDKLRKLLPFSDAKEGPLSQLTKSGRSVFQTMATGMNQEAPLLRDTSQVAFAGMMNFQGFDVPQVNQSFNEKLSFEKERNYQKVDIREIVKEQRSESTKETVKGNGKRFVIEKLELKVERIDSPDDLYRQLEDAVNGYGEDDE